MTSRYTPEQQRSIDDFQKALEKHCAEMGILSAGEYLGDWIMIGSSQKIQDPDMTYYWRAFSNGSQPTHITAGLLHYAQISNDRCIWNPGATEDDED